MKMVFKVSIARLLWLLILVATANGQNNSLAAMSGETDKSPVSSLDNASPEPATKAGTGVDQTQPLTRDAAVRLALQQASAFQQAQINEQIAVQDIRQSKAALYPRVAVNPNLIFTSPSLGNFNPSTQTSRPPSFLGANAVTEYQGLITTSGEIDVSGRLRAAVRRNQALLEAARTGTEIERRNLIFAVNDAYFNLELATARRRGAEENLHAAEEFENNVKLNLDAGEVAPVELTRARLQTTVRRDEFEQTKTSESAATDGLRVLIGYQFTAPVATTDLLVEVPQPGEIENLSQTAISTRPELVGFDAQLRAAQEEAKAAQRERRTNITYSVSPGFISDSLNPTSIKNSVGVQASVGVSILLFDRGASRSRQTQAQLRAQSLQIGRIQNERQFAQAFFTARTQGLSAITRIRLAAQGIEDARRNLSASLARYRAGEALITEVTDAQNILVVQQTTLYQAIFDYQTARARLLQAIGK